MKVKKQMLLQTVVCALNIFFGLITHRFATFYYVAGILICAVVGGVLLIWGIRTIRHWRELDIAWGALNILNLVCAIPAVLSGVSHLIDVVLRGWYPPF